MVLAKDVLRYEVLFVVLVTMVVAVVVTTTVRVFI